MESTSKLPYLIAVIALVVGLAGGYYYGNVTGRADLLAEQTVAAEAAQQEAQEQIAESANPFGADQANVFEGSYTNPLQGSINPFAQ